MIGFSHWQSLIVSNVQGYFMFARLIELTWWIYDLVSFNSHELCKTVWFERECCRASFGITKWWERLLNDCIHLHKLIFYCSVCLKKRGQVADFNDKRVVSWAWWLLVFYFNSHSLISEVCSAIHRVDPHWGGVWNQLGKRRSALNCCCKVQPFRVHGSREIVYQLLTELQSDRWLYRWVH